MCRCTRCWSWRIRAWISTWREVLCSWCGHLSSYRGYNRWRDISDAATHGAAWVLAARGALRPVTVPFVRRVVDASLSGLLLARVALQPAAAMEVAIPWQAEAAAVAPSGNGWAHAFIQREARPRGAEVLKFRAVEWAAEDTAGQESGHELVYHVQLGDSLWAIAERFYGDGEQEVRL